MRVLLCLAGLFAFAAAHTCPPLWTGGPTGCYRYFSTPKNWEDARQHCMSFSSCEGGTGDLVSIGTPKENGFLTLLRKGSVLNTPAPSFWTGGNDQMREGQWQWSNGQPLTGGFVNWEQGQPNNQGGAENCLRFPGQRSINQWDDWDCFTELPYVCHLYEAPQQPGNPNNPNNPNQPGRPAFIYGRPQPAQIVGHGHY